MGPNLIITKASCHVSPVQLEIKASFLSIFKSFKRNPKLCFTFSQSDCEATRKEKKIGTERMEKRIALNFFFVARKLASKNKKRHP